MSEVLMAERFIFYTGWFVCFYAICFGILFLVNGLMLMSPYEYTTFRYVILVVASILLLRICSATACFI